MKKIAIIQKCPTNVKWDKYFENAEVTVFNLSPVKVEKLLVKNMDEAVRFGNYDEFDAVILVGSEALKQFSPLTAVTSCSGTKVPTKTERKSDYYALINPGMIHVKPEAKVEFETAIKSLVDKIILEVSTEIDADVKMIQSEQEAYDYLCYCLADPGKEVALDSETSGFSYLSDYLLGISIAPNVKSCAYIDAIAMSERCVEVLKEICRVKKVVLHNAKFDYKFFAAQLDTIFRKGQIDDTMLMHYVLDEREGTHGLKDLASKYTDLGNYDLELDLYKTQYCKEHGLKKEEFSYAFIPFEILAKYGALDALATLKLYFKFDPLIRKNDNLTKLYDKLLRPAMEFLCAIEMDGIPISMERLNKAQEVLTNKIYELSTQLYTMPELKDFEKSQGAMLNVNSPVQLRTFLFDFLNLPVPELRTDTGEISTNKDVLRDLAEFHPAVNLIHEIKKLGKIKSSFIDKLIRCVDPDGKVRTNFNLQVTSSGRLSSSGNFNAQQLPRDDGLVKGCIKARDGYKIVNVDLTTAEVYYAAVLSGDRELQNVFIRMNEFPDQYSDFHSTIAHMVFNLTCLAKEVKALYPYLRQAAKAISFGILYGSGPQKVADTVNASLIEAGLEPTCTKTQAMEYIRQYFDKFPRLEKWIKECHNQIKSEGFIYNYYGRKRRLRNINSMDRSIAGDELRSGFNAVIQSTSSDCLLSGAISAYEEIRQKGIDANIFALVHDSCVAEVRDDQVDTYLEILMRNIHSTKPSIPGCPIGVSVESIHQDYAGGKLEKQYPEVAAC